MELHPKISASNPTPFLKAHDFMSSIVLHIIYITTEHSKIQNEIITQLGLIESEIGPGVPQSSAPQARVRQEYQRHKPRVSDYESILSMLCEIF